MDYVWYAGEYAIVWKTGEVFLCTPDEECIRNGMRAMQKRFLDMRIMSGTWNAAVTVSWKCFITSIQHSVSKTKERGRMFHKMEEILKWQSIVS